MVRTKKNNIKKDESLNSGFDKVKVGYNQLIPDVTIVLTENSMSPKIVKRLINECQTPLFYHKFLIRRGDHTRSYILNAIMDFVAPTTFMPVHFNEAGDASYFLARNCLEVIMKIVSNKFLVPHPCDPENPLKIIIFANCMAAEDVPMEDASENMRQVINYSFEGTFQSLDLSKFSDNEGLINHCPLFNEKVFMNVMTLAAELAPRKVDLGYNNIKDISHLNVLKNTVEVLDLSNNCLEDISCLMTLRDFTKLRILKLTDNPLCEKYYCYDYVLDVKRYCPKLQKLDGVNVTTPEFRKNFLCCKDAEDLTAQFLEHFFTVYDSPNRTDLIDLYHSHVIFSVTSKIIPNQMNSKSMKLGHYGIQNPFAVFGITDVMKLFEEFPKSQHDAYPMVCDVMLYTDTNALIVVSGIFRELKQTLSFNRSFYLQRYGEQFRIVNEQLHISNAMDFQMGWSFAFPANIEYSGNPLPYFYNQYQELENTMRQLTKMNLEYCQKYLVYCNYDLKKALIVFAELHIHNDVPKEAFEFDSSVTLKEAQIPFCETLRKKVYDSHHNVSLKTIWSTLDNERFKATNDPPININTSIRKLYRKWNDPINVNRCLSTIEPSNFKPVNVQSTFQKADPIGSNTKKPVPNTGSNVVSKPSLAKKSEQRAQKKPSIASSDPLLHLANRMAQYKKLALKRISETNSKNKSGLYVPVPLAHLTTPTESSPTPSASPKSVDSAVVHVPRPTSSALIRSQQQASKVKAELEDAKGRWSQPSNASTSKNTDFTKTTGLSPAIPNLPWRSVQKAKGLENQKSNITTSPKNEKPAIMSPPSDLPPWLAAKKINVQNNSKQLNKQSSLIRIPLKNNTPVATTSVKNVPATTPPKNVSSTIPPKNATATAPRKNMPATAPPKNLPATTPLKNVSATTPKNAPPKNVSATTPKNVPATAPPKKVLATAPPKNVPATTPSKNVPATAPIKDAATSPLQTDAIIKMRQNLRDEKQRLLQLKNKRDTPNVNTKTVEQKKAMVAGPSGATILSNVVLKPTNSNSKKAEPTNVTQPQTSLSKDVVEKMRHNIQEERERLLKLKTTMEGSSAAKKPKLSATLASSASASAVSNKPGEKSGAIAGEKGKQDGSCVQNTSNICSDTITGGDTITSTQQNVVSSVQQDKPTVPIIQTPKKKKCRPSKKHRAIIKLEKQREALERLNSSSTEGKLAAVGNSNSKSTSLATATKSGPSVLGEPSNEDDVEMPDFSKKLFIRMPNMSAAEIKEVLSATPSDLDVSISKPTVVRSQEDSPDSAIDLTSTEDKKNDNKENNRIKVQIKLSLLKGGSASITNTFESAITNIESAEELTLDESIAPSSANKTDAGKMILKNTDERNKTVGKEHRRRNKHKQRLVKRLGKKGLSLSDLTEKPVEKLESSAELQTKPKLNLLKSNTKLMYPARKTETNSDVTSVSVELNDTPESQQSAQHLQTENQIKVMEDSEKLKSVLRSFTIRLTRLSQKDIDSKARISEVSVPNSEKQVAIEQHVTKEEAAKTEQVNKDSEIVKIEEVTIKTDITSQFEVNQFKISPTGSTTLKGNDDIVKQEAPKVTERVDSNTKKTTETKIINENTKPELESYTTTEKNSTEANVKVECESTVTTAQNIPKDDVKPEPESNKTKENVSTENVKSKPESNVTNVGDATATKQEIIKENEPESENLLSNIQYKRAIQNASINAKPDVMKQEAKVEPETGIDSKEESKSGNSNSPQHLEREVVKTDPEIKEDKSGLENQAPQHLEKEVVKTDPEIKEDKSGLENQAPQHLEREVVKIDPEIKEDKSGLENQAPQHLEREVVKTDPEIKEDKSGLENQAKEAATTSKESSDQVSKINAKEEPNVKKEHKVEQQLSSPANTKIAFLEMEETPDTVNSDDDDDSPLNFFKLGSDDDD